jgi:hypothetical protein
MILFLNPYWSNNFVKLLASVCPIISIASNKPIVTYLVCQLDLKKFITRVNISYASFDIHKSKLYVAKIQSSNFGKTYTHSIFSIKLGNISWENYFLERNTTLGHKCNIKHLNHTLPTNYNGTLLFTIKRPRSCKKSFCCISSFLKNSFTTKKCRFYICWDIWLFLCRLPFNVFYYLIVNFFLNFL